MYCETCLKRNQAITETCLLAEDVYNPEDPKFKYLYETEVTCNVKNFGPLRFCCRLVSLYFELLHIHAPYNIRVCD
jgi:hypothetical protein